ncbi:MAG: hypothetical protein A4S08_01425 [Proteobacteria bacterium SG_bin4]|nr:MAG: hypothetical protein A4S08_01425 [Proteobacteria bacterium SG_bin4]
MTFFRAIRYWRYVLIITALLIFSAHSAAEIAIPILKSRVTDLTATLSAAEANQLEQKLAAFEKDKGSQIAVLLLPTTQPETIEQYSMRVAETWKLGRKGIDDGVLLLIAKNDRTLRLEVGYGLEGAVPDAIAKRIIADIITPHFKQGRFAEGINAGIDALMGIIKGEPLPSLKAHHPAKNQESVFDTIAFLLILPFVFGRVLQVMLGRLAGAAATGIGLGFISWIAFSSLATALLIAAFGFLITLFLTPAEGIYRNRRGYSQNHDWGSGGFGSGGGFRGGGGFGGGGASGRW